MPVHRSSKQEHSSKTDRRALAFPFLESQRWQTGKGHVIITLKIRRLFRLCRDRQQPEHRPINFKKEETAAHMLPVSDLRQSLPNTGENIFVENFFFKNSNFPAFVMVFFFSFFYPFSPSPDIYWTPPICKHHCAPVCLYSLLHSPI